MGPGVIFLLMPALAFANLEVHIKSSSSKDKASVTFKGNDSNIISDIDKEAFNLTTSTLKAAAKAYSGGTPLDVFVKSPTPWGDLYKTYKWAEVRRDTEIKKVKLVSVKTEKVTLAKQHFTNNLTSGDSTFTADMKADVVNSLLLRNSILGKVVSVGVNYNVDLDLGLNPPMHFNLVSQLGLDKLEKDVKKIQADTEVKFTLKPSQSAKCILNATKVTTLVSIDYESSLDGYVAANYNPKYKDHHFWAYDVKELMDSAGMPLVKKNSILLTVQYYANAYVYVTDLDSGNAIVSVPADYVI